MSGGDPRAMVTKNLRENLRLNERFAGLFCRLLVAVMMACLMVTVDYFGQRLAPGWRGEYLPYAAFFIAIEAMFTKQRTRSLAPFSGEWLAFRLAELVLLLIGLKALLYLLRGPGQFFTDLGLWQHNFLEAFFQGEFLLACVLAVFVWAASGLYADDLVEMTGDEILLGSEIPPGLATERMNARQGLVDRTFFLGIVMVALTGLAHFDLKILWGDHPPVSGSVVNVLVYFLASLALLSQTQFSIMRASWTWERIPLSRNLAARWTAYGLAFLALTTLIALALPTGYSVGFLGVLAYLINWFLYIAMVLVGLVLLLFSALIRLLGLPGLRQTPGVPAIQPPPPPAEALRLLPTPYPWVEVLKSMAFWAIFIGVVGFSIYQYLSQNRDLLAQLRRLPAVMWLEKAWHWLRSWVQGAGQTLGGALEAGLRRLRPQRAGGFGSQVWGYLNLRRLSPRGRVLFFYLALVRRGADSGLERAACQTPREYALHLRRQLPEAEEQLMGLTETFVEARYSQHTVSAETAGRAQWLWEQVRAALQRRRTARKQE
jgi:hypothetical protein